MIFTANTTEAINLVAESWAMDRKGYQADRGEYDHGTQLERTAVAYPARLHSDPLEVDADGFVNLVELQSPLRSYNQTANTISSASSWWR